MRAAGREAAVVCAAVEPEDTSHAPPYGLASQTVRTQGFSHVRGITAAVSLDPEGRTLERLRPYWLADCPVPPTASALRRQARAGAARVIELPPIPVCRARSIAAEV